MARVELGAENYNSALRFNGNSQVVGLGVQQYPTANALQVSKGVIAELNVLAKQFPQGIHYTVAFDTTDFVAESVREVVITLLLSILLVVLVIYVFLQNPRSTMIPAVTIPVSLIGAFFVMKIFGFTINTITLFGLTLATGLVVDDAIVVIENIARHIEMNKGRQSGIASAAQAMREIQSAVVASSLGIAGRLHSGRFLSGHDRPALQAVRFDDRRCDLHLALPSAHVGAGNVGTPADRRNGITVHFLSLVQRRPEAVPSLVRIGTAAFVSLSLARYRRLRTRAACHALHVREDADVIHSQ